MVGNSHVGTTTKITLYDDWNPIAEYLSPNLLSPISHVRSFTWGMDLSGTMQGAGGVGGLLAVTDSTGTYYPTYDGNGNVSEYLDSTGAVVAHYEYDPFGKTTVATGPKANDFAHRFSTKPLDITTGLYYYGYRFYDPETGRWPSRDHIAERGGVNLYGFVGNDGVNELDFLGNQISYNDLDTAIDAAKDQVGEATKETRLAGVEEFEGHFNTAAQPPPSFIYAKRPPSINYSISISKGGSPPNEVEGIHVIFGFEKAVLVFCCPDKPDKYVIGGMTTGRQNGSLGQITHFDLTPPCNDAIIKVALHTHNYGYMTINKGEAWPKKPTLFNSGGSPSDVENKTLGDGVQYFVVNETPSSFILSPY